MSDHHRWMWAKQKWHICSQVEGLYYRTCPRLWLHVHSYLFLICAVFLHLSLSLSSPLSLCAVTQRLIIKVYQSLQPNKRHKLVHINLLLLARASLGSWSIQGLQQPWNLLNFHSITAPFKVICFYLFKRIVKLI